MLNVIRRYRGGNQAVPAYTLSNAERELLFTALVEYRGVCLRRWRDAPRVHLSPTIAQEARDTWSARADRAEALTNVLVREDKRLTSVRVSW